MNKIQLYIATTLDGYIARENGSLDWLMNFPNPNLLDYGYGDFIKEVDVIVMGKTTYEEVAGFDGDWPYSNCKTFVITSNKNFEATTENTIILNEITEAEINLIKSHSVKIFGL